jgi:hydrogenase maturation protease
MSDEGVGVHVVERLVENYSIPEEVQVLDGGTLGMDLLYYLEGAEDLLIIDAVETRREAGTLIRLEGDEVPAFLSMKISPHQIGVPDMLAVARLKDIFPKRLVLFGIQPEKIEIGVDLSPGIASKIDLLAQKVVTQLKDWGYILQQR